MPSNIFSTTESTESIIRPDLYIGEIIDIFKSSGKFPESIDLLIDKYLSQRLCNYISAESFSNLAGILSYPVASDVLERFRFDFTTTTDTLSRFLSNLIGQLGRPSSSDWLKG